MNNNSGEFLNKKLLSGFLCLIPLLLHLYTNIFAGYGIFRDELYYIACSQRLDFGYVDQPPFSIYILKLNRLMFGDSLFALRFIPAVNSALTVLFTCLMTVKLGGRKTAIIISSVAVIFAPVYLGMNAIYSMNSFDILLWSIAFYLIILIIKENKFSSWIYLGIAIGMGLLNKIGFLWLGFGFFLGLLFTDNRKYLLTFKPYLCAFIALMIFSPFIIWNFNNDLAHFEFIRNATSGKYSHIERLDFITGQLMNMNPVSLIVWLCGLYYFLFNKNGKRFRILGIIYSATFAILIINGHSKAEYLASSYTALFAGGAVFIEGITSVKFQWIKYVIILLIVTSGLIITPLALPLLPVETYIKYSERLGLTPSTSEDKELSKLPQFYADMFGWEEMAEDVSKVYLTIPESERNSVIFFGRNYGEAGAIEYFSRKYLLPKAISSHNNFWIWGFGNYKDPVFIIIGGERNDHLEVFENVEQAGVHSAEFAMPYENNLPIYIARNLKVNVEEVWKKIKHYD